MMEFQSYFNKYICVHKKDKKDNKKLISAQNCNEKLKSKQIYFLCMNFGQSHKYVIFLIRKYIHNSNQPTIGKSNGEAYRKTLILE